MILSPGSLRIYLYACPDSYRVSPSIAGLPRRTGIVSGFCSSSPYYAFGFLQTQPHSDALAFS
ncbi:MAG: hypothetical protein WCU00_01280 [Candidatus Latescibacterota bacterium]